MLLRRGETGWACRDRSFACLLPVRLDNGCERKAFERIVFDREDKTDTRLSEVSLQNAFVCALAEYLHLPASVFSELVPDLDVTRNIRERILLAPRTLEVDSASHLHGDAFIEQSFGQGELQLRPRLGGSR